MFRAMHGHLANFFAYNSKHQVDTVFDHFTTMLVSLLVARRCKLLPWMFYPFFSNDIWRLFGTSSILVNPT